ncbi:PAS domain S-box protein [Halovenus sp. WSH3]|uniref:histidine kinase n=1 Tax=Halovenus carboxidivorans TaxID=2692199 RepID=A0A6B0T9B0_9EURY|nr:PAS domain S-box protein [Halovenus carboxidivorans]MXR52153.1 PAS domain S-box protein [Halovenus carboxidivorans]
MSRTQVLIDSEGERAAVVSLLEDRYEVVTGDGVRQADLYLVDDHSLPTYREQLRERKRADGQVFCPVVLVRRRRTQIDRQAFHDPTAGTGVIDEVLTAPLDRETVIWRLDNLLTRRDTTRNLVDRNAQLERREQELERYKTFVEQSSDVVSVLDEAGHIEYQSPAVGRALGYEQSELIGQNAFDFVHPDDREALWETYEQLLEDPDRTVADEARFRTADGDWRWLSIRATNQLDGEVIDGIIVNSRDVTERKREEQKRQRTVRRMTDAILGLDSDWQFIEINEQAESILDIDAETVLGERIWDVFPEATGTTFYDVYHTVMDEREPRSFEERLREMDMWFEVNVYPEPHGGISIYFRDITDRKARENRIERLNREFETVFENVRDGLFLLAVEPDGAIMLRRSNDAAGPVLAGERPVAPGEPLDGRADPELLDSCRTCLQRRGSGVLELETTVEGEDSTFDVRLSPVVVDGTVEMIVGSARDITERKRYERRIEAQRDDLKLLNQMVRHDIRNDLQVIKTHGELLAQEIDPELGSSADSIVSAAENAIVLTEEARNLSEVMLRSGETQQPTPLATTLRTQIEQVRSAHEAATIEIDGTLPEVDVQADEMLDSVFDNLLKNSVVHNDSPDPRTVVSAGVDGEYATVRIADNGPGIPDERKARIFEKGSKGGHSDGSGIGLYLVDTLVDQYGGTVDIEDRGPSAESDGGAVFVVRLPLAS